MTAADLKKQIRSLLEGMSFEDAATIEYIGKLAKEVMWEDQGRYLSEEQREANNRAPMTAAEELPDLSIVIGDTRIRFNRADERKPAVSIPFGLSDRVTQATLPKDWMLQALYQFLIDADGGKTDYAEEVAAWMNKWIDIATVTNEDGSIKIDKSKLPAPTAEVFTSGLVDSHKRKTRGRAKGSTSFNLSLSVELDDSTPARIPQRTTGFTNPVDAFESPDIPSLARQSTDTDCRGKYANLNRVSVLEEHPQGGRLADLSTGTTPVDRESDDRGQGESDGFPVPVEADPSLSTNALLVNDEWKAEGVLREIIGTEPLTKGAIRKAVADRVPEPMWVAELERMVSTGEVTRTGERRSTRYTSCEVAA